MTPPRDPDVIGPLLAALLLGAHERRCATCRGGSQCASQLVLERRLKEARARYALARCEREIEAMRAQPDVPAWLVTLGIEDWEREKREIAGAQAKGAGA